MRAFNSWLARMLLWKFQSSNSLDSRVPKCCCYDFSFIQCHIQCLILVDYKQSSPQNTYCIHLNSVKEILSQRKEQQVAFFSSHSVHIQSATNNFSFPFFYGFTRFLCNIKSEQNGMLIRVRVSFLTFSHSQTNRDARFKLMSLR